MKANASDNGNRKYILAQLKEEVEQMLESSSANAKRVAENALQILDELGKEHAITELAKERIKRCSRKYEKNGEDIEFRVLKLDTSNMKDIRIKFPKQCFGNSLKKKTKQCLVF